MGAPNKTGITWKQGTPEEKQKMREYQRSYRNKNKEKVQESARRHAYRKNYGITLENYNEMFETQNECCAICLRHRSVFEKNFYVDHCHKTLRVRGLLCFDCNTTLGRVNDNIETLKRAISYLEAPL